MHSVHPTPKFSIITVTYNAEKVLEDTIQSVISQTYHHVEYIIVDGASKDGTLSIIDRYRSRITTVVSEPDKGLYDAMNKAISLASGDYHSIHGSVLPDVIYGETAIVDKDRHFLHMRRLSTPEKLDWRSFKQGMLVCHQAFFARHTLVEPYDLNYRYSADFDWCIRIMKKARTLHNTHLTIIDYLDEGMTTQNRKASLKERFRIMTKHYGWISTAAHHAWFVLRLIIKPGQ